MDRPLSEASVSPPQANNSPPEEVKPALAAILAEEKAALTSVQPLIDQLEERVESLPAAGDIDEKGYW
jgi:hypothetical protein